MSKFRHIKITTAIIAGGKSSRMGTDKAAVVFRDKTLLEHAIAILLPFSEKILISSNKNYKGIAYPIINDVFKNIGPIGGLYSILKASDTEQVLVIPIDTPLISEKLIAHIIKKHNNNYNATLCKTKDGLQMLVGIYTKKMLPLIEKQIQNKDYKLSNLLKDNKSQVIELDEFSDSFLNINTKDDLNRIE